MGQLPKFNAENELIKTFSIFLFFSDRTTEVEYVEVNSYESGKSEFKKKQD